MSRENDAVTHGSSLAELSLPPAGEIALLHVPEALREETEAALRYAREQHAPATRKAYQTDFKIFEMWCMARSLESLPASESTVATYLAAEAELGARPSTVGRRLAAIRYVHALAGQQPPTAGEAVRATMKGIRRNLGRAQRGKAPATAERLIAMVRQIPGGLRGKRDRAVLLLGFAGAFRRSELTALTVEDIEVLPEGLRVTIRRSKTDQEGAGQVIAIPRGQVACPVDAVSAWLAAARIDTGPIFRPIAKGNRIRPEPLTPHSVGAIVKRYAKEAGLDPADFSGHSLRAGFLTSAAARGASIFKMMDVSRHRSADTLRGYVRDADAFKNHAGDGLL